MFKIEKDVPAPKAGSWSKRKYPYQEMDIGDSFFIPDDLFPKDKNGLPVPMASAFTFRNRPKRFLQRNVEGGIRIWRVE